MPNLNLFSGKKNELPKENKKDLKDTDHFYAVILAGGGGTRLWPKSRKDFPKPFLTITGGKKTLLQLTYERVEPIIPKERIIIITSDEHVSLVKEQLPNHPNDNIIAEPTAKNTAMAMGIASAFVNKRDPESVIINVASDAFFKDIKKFQETAMNALQVAQKTDNIVAIGIRPTSPNTGLGYIRIGDEFESDKYKLKSFVFKSKGFKEKPDLATAQSFLASGQYLWNANLYCWSTKTCLDAFALHAPEIYKQLNAVQNSLNTSNMRKVIEKAYKEVENVSIDYAVSEKADNLLIIPGDFGWSDIGDWKVVYEAHESDSNGNVIVGNAEKAVSVGSKNSLIENNGRLIALVGLSDVIVVDTDDAILICAKDKTQDVKKVVEQLKAEKLDKYL